ncbi:hypothetical protein A0H81_08969 [Grifola frondosa]|uniref:Uncharacterized protein n=1 Tax=Grifola frondosa TaxID=5627 RepID=A0A1C7M2Y5_GRIFR|nr:hypothetical protein A0H81_08969 [Grifola frondosa]
MRLSTFFSGLVLVSVPLPLWCRQSPMRERTRRAQEIQTHRCVIGVHSHVQLTDGQVMFQTGNSTYIHQAIANYDEVKSSGVPYNYRISSSGELLPLDLGTITDDVITARKELAAATSGGSFLTEFASVSNALTSNSVVKNHYNLAKTEAPPPLSPAASADPNDAPSFFTRGISNSTLAADITILCGLCGHGNPWQDRRFF